MRRKFYLLNLLLFFGCCPSAPSAPSENKDWKVTLYTPQAVYVEEWVIHSPNKPSIYYYDSCHFINDDIVAPIGWRLKVEEVLQKSEIRLK